MEREAGAQSIMMMLRERMGASLVYFVCEVYNFFFKIIEMYMNVSHVCV